MEMFRGGEQYVETFFIPQISLLFLVMKWGVSSKCIYESKYALSCRGLFLSYLVFPLTQEEPLVPFSKYETFVEFRKLSVVSQAGSEIEDEEQRFQLYNDYLLKNILRYTLKFILDVFILSLLKI